MITPELSDAIAKIVSEHLGYALRVESSRSVGGGCISSAFIVQLSDGRSVFAKANDLSFQVAFEIEALGLRELHQAGALKVPSAYGVGTTSSQSFLVCEAVSVGLQPDDFFARFGRALAQHHRHSIRTESSHRYGWHSDNFLGSSRQVNRWENDWVDFFAEHRLQFQIALAKDRGKANVSLARLMAGILQRLPDLIGDSPRDAVLLHGDLWSGNYLSDDSGNPVMVDPAVYYGSREAEFGMLKLFGSCPPSFYEAYNETWPMPAGWERRAEVYKLYHLLNHLNLFGVGYLADCIACAESIVSF